MLKIRLARTGAKKQPQYRIVVADEQEKRDGRFIEIVGHYNPMVETTKKLELKKDRYLHWLSVGAQPTKAARDLFESYERISRVSS